MPVTSGAQSTEANLNGTTPAAPSNAKNVAFQAGSPYADPNNPGYEIRDVTANLPLNTDGTLAADSDSDVASQKATKTYADTKVAGAASSTDSDFMQFSGTGGKTAKDGGLSLDTDGTLSADSDSRIASQKAVKTYVDAGIGAGPTKAGIQDESYTYAADTGAANAYVVTLSPVPASLVAGLEVAFKAANTNTGASTLNVNSLGATPIKKLDGATALTSGDIVAGQIVTVVYDGTNFQMQSPGAAASGGGSGTVTHTVGALTSGQLVEGNGAADIKVGDLSGDVTTSGGMATTVAKIQGTAVSTPTGTGAVVLANSPALSGNPTAPTQASSDNSTKLATTAFVQNYAPGGGGSVVLQTDGVNNGSQTKENLVAGPGISLTDDGVGDVTIAGSFAWGGDGSDGAVTFDGTSTVLGLAPASSVYTLSRDIFCTNLTINSGVTIKSNNFAIFCAGTLTVNGTIQNNGTAAGSIPASGAGGNASGSSGGSAGSTVVTGGSASGHYARLATTGLGGNAGGAGATGNGSQGTAGGNGGTPSRAPFASTAPTTGSAGAAGGAGGNGGTGTGAAARSGGSAGGAPTVAVFPGQVPSNAIAGVFFNNGTTVSAYGFQNGSNGSAPGGGGGGGDGTNAGGGGGGSGAEGGPAGIVGIFAKSIVVGASGAIQCNGGAGGNGGNGASPTAGNAGGGGGGGGGSGGQGGIMWLVYASLTNSGTIQAVGGAGGTGGTHGTGHGTGANGTDGSNGPTGSPGVVISIKC